MIVPALPDRTTVARLAMAFFLAAQMLGWITYAQRDESTAPPPPALPPPNGLTAVRRALREFDRFLDHHPLLEDRLRLETTLIADQAFLRENPELRDFLQANPNIVEGLKTYPRYFLYRALIRQANAPLPYHELAPMKDLFQQQPNLEKTLIKNPELVRDPVFLDAHPALRDFLRQHATLERVFLPPSAPPRSK